MSLYFPWMERQSMVHWEQESFWVKMRGKQVSNLIPKMLLCCWISPLSSHWKELNSVLCMGKKIFDLKNCSRRNVFLQPLDLGMMSGCYFELASRSESSYWQCLRPSLLHHLAPWRSRRIERMRWRILLDSFPLP